LDDDGKIDNVANLNAYISRIDVLAILDAVAVPEPGTIVLFCSGIAGLAVCAPRRPEAWEGIMVRFTYPAPMHTRQSRGWPDFLESLPPLSCRCPDFLLQQISLQYLP
jgi:hypothetical protein